MKETNDKEAARAGDDVVWPPPPTERTEPLTPQAAIVTRPYLIHLGWLDTIAGIGTGVIFWWVVLYGVVNYVLCYLIPPRIDFFWRVVDGFVIALMASLLVWLRLRSLYRRFANTMFCAGVAFGGVVVWFYN